MTVQTFLTQALAHAQLANHIFPEYAACEAALESAWGDSKLAREANNLFGEHQHQIPIFDTYYLHPNDTVDHSSAWIKFPTWKDSFISRMNTLHRLSVYAPALAATTGEEFVQLVSQHWSQDAFRAQHVILIHSNHFRNGLII